MNPFSFGFYTAFFFFYLYWMMMVVDRYTVVSGNDTEGRDPSGIFDFCLLFLR
jgi:hypothetical protein